MNLDLIGLTEGEAINLLEENDCEFRVVSEDGEFFLATADYKPYRYNLSIDKGMISGVRMG